MLKGNILTPTGWVNGQLAFDGRITGLTGQPVAPEDNADGYILPGFIDLHIHGGGGRDIMEANGAVHTVSRLHARHGTTSLLATTMTAPVDEITTALQDVALAMTDRPAGCARVLGVHLEGPYINPGKLGAQPDVARHGVLAEILAFHAIAPIRVLTLAPELTGHMALIRPLVDAGIRVQIGHTLGSYEEGVTALESGASSFTHLFNAMTGLHHREPGMVGAALAHGRFAELIPDLLHVHPGAIRVARRAIPGLYCVTDSTAAAGMPDGNYKLGSQTVCKCMGGVRLADGTLAGSTLTMDVALRNLVDVGLSLAEASDCLSRYPAELLDLQDRGRLAVGNWADLVVFDRNLRLVAVYIEGECIELTDA
ncbi:N-acetylglucosamine-6-phosphate deacetylase [Leeia oryzae]|uniref:N-acetylglucosamine-6-phosphate deacetylase n=1 Tax=Leeia oryzae TaxID=356662 RepID=UPI00037C64FE|nr:N-acetylglucosamine-6-phosphate deacetylase [Leeia oryzae]